MNLWVDPDKKLVGLDAEPSYETEDPKAVEFELDSGVQVEASKPPPKTATFSRLLPGQLTSTASVPRVNLTHPSLPTIRFLPDGTISENSPQKIRLSGRDGVSLWVALAEDKLSYEIRRTEP